MSHAGNVTFNSFAAEVVFHADYLGSFIGGFVEDSLIRADMSIAMGDYEIDNMGVSYYNLNSAIVQEQIDEHGEY